MKISKIILITLLQLNLFVLASGLNISVHSCIADDNIAVNILTGIKTNHDCISCVTESGCCEVKPLADSCCETQVISNIVEHCCYEVNDFVKLEPETMLYINQIDIEPLLRIESVFHSIINESNTTHFLPAINISPPSLSKLCIMLS